MADKRVEAITSRDVDFSRWYTDVVRNAELMDYSSVKGCMIMRPAGTAIWEAIQSGLDKRFKATGHENVQMPLFIPESLLNKEKEHVEGFAPEVAWVTQGGDDQLTERLAIRPTSETLFCEHYSKIIQSWRDLPKLYNQWVSVVRWEKTTRPFLRTTEFWWQEGHTAHATAEEARKEALDMLNLYENFLRTDMAIPVIKGQKTNKEKFAGAEATFTMEAMMYDGKALQAGTTHDFGDGFARAFNIQYSDKNNELQYVHQTSWGVSTRLIGALIMVHSDDSGLVLPPAIAQTQIVVVPIGSNKPEVMEAARAVADELSEFHRVKLDDSDNTPGWKFAEHEMRGVPLRIEVGPRDIAAGQVVAVRRDTGQKIFAAMNDLQADVAEIVASIQADLYTKAKKMLDSRIYTATGWETFADTIRNKPGFVRAMWCGDEVCEDKVKEELQATSRCIPFEEEQLSDTCVCCGRPAQHEVIWGKAY